MRVGILGGTFDPIHVGHLIAASEVHTQLSLDLVVFVPAGNPWQKSSTVVAPAQARFDMVARAIAGDPRFAVSDIELLREGPSYAIDTVRQWKLEHSTDELFWIMGADALAKVHTWHDWERLVQEVKIVCVNRPGSPTPDVSFAVTHVGIPDVYVSATEVRSRFAAGIPNTYLVPDSVRNYITEHGLYQG